MAIEITVPRLGWTMEEGVFVGWLKPAGARLRPGELLFALESDKATEEIEALDGGILHIPTEAPAPGTVVKVGQVLGYLLADGEAAPQAGPAPPPAAAPQATPAPAAAGPSVRRLAQALAVDLAQVTGTGAGGRVTEEDVRRSQAGAGKDAEGPRGRPASSPRARRVAEELGVDWKSLRGSGRDGRIRERDVREAATVQARGRLIPHTNVRRTIAARMVAGVTQAAPVTLTTRADATNLVGLRRQFKAAAAGPDDLVPGYTDLIVKLVALALRQHPLLQAQWREDGLFVPNQIDVAVAVHTEAGLLAPVLRGADQLPLREIAARARELGGRAREGRLTGEQMRDATFTVTNLGGFGIDAFTPIIHLPQCAVLGVGRIVREPAVVGESVVPRDVLTLSLTFDHRVVDGAPAAQFLQTVRGLLENPAPRLIA